MTDIFKSEAHKMRLLEVMQLLGKIYQDKLDPEYGSALYILTSHLGTWQKAQEYITAFGIDFETMLEEVDFSGGVSVLIRLAGNLFNGQTRVEPVEMLRLDESNFNIALNAIRLRRDGLDFQAERYNREMDERNRLAYESRDKPWLPLYDGE